MITGAEVMPEWAQIKHRGYSVQRELPVGTIARLLSGYGDIPAGALVEIYHYSNAGFRGIEAWVKILADRRRMCVPAGLLEKEDT